MRVGSVVAFAKLFKQTYWELISKIQGVSAKTFEPNNSIIFQRIFVKFEMQIF
jgi:hypothetical protein